MSDRDHPSQEASAGQQRELLKRLLREKSVRPKHREASFAQERLWFLDQLEGANPFYNVICHSRLRGRLDPAALEQSMREIVRRHESLRTTFRDEQGKPVQVVAPAAECAMPLVDLSHTPKGRQREEVRRLIEQEAQEIFDLEAGPLLRSKLLRLADDDHVLVLATHHVVSDGWSMGVLVRELAAHYEAISQGNSSALPEPSIQYADFAAWQRTQIDSPKMQESRAYWKERLDGLAPLELAADHPRPAVQRFRGGKRSLEIPRPLFDKLEELGHGENATLFMTLLSAFVVLLHRYTQQQDIAVGFPIAGRNRVELEGLIGFFVNMLVLRTDVDPGVSFRELLSEVRDNVLKAYAHQDYPFEMLVDDLQPDRDMSRNPLFQVSLTVHNERIGASELPELTIGRPTFPGFDVSEFDVDPATTRFDLELNFWQRHGAAVGTWVFDTDLFDATTIERMIGHYRALLESIASDPQQRVSELSMLTSEERRQVVTDWNLVEASAPPTRCIHELFAEQAARTPDAVAVTFRDQRLTYRELNRRANLVAHYLQRRSVGPDSLVALYMDRSVEMVVAILGILKAGGAYLPIDLLYPRGRIEFMLDESQAAVLITQESLLDKLPDCDAEIVCLDRDWVSIAAGDGENPPNCVTPDNLAYVIYTSGSTGRPKGVLITHGNVVRLFTETEAWFSFSSSDVWTLFHSYAFDFSVWEIWGALLYGGRLVVVPHLVSRSPRDFLDLLRREEVTVLNQTPSAFGQLIAADEETADSAGPLSLRLVIFGGEALNPQMLQPWFDRHGDRSPQLVNMYGITETTVHVTYYPLSREDLQRQSRSPIGQRIPDLQIYILDAHGNPVPVGVPGELYVGGRGVARGYLNRRSLTEERFTANRFSSAKDAHLYRTGDLGRWLPDGSIEYLGRCDDQVKIRGFRIELGEIDAAIRANPAVRDVAVLVRGDTTADKRLAAYVVPDDPEATAVPGLRDFLTERLPSYMIPSAFVFLARLPLSANGKVDRKALPDVKQTRDEEACEFVAARTPVEEKMAEVWSELLKLDRIGVFDNFFEIGGDSLMATQVVSRLRRAFEVDLPLSAIFKHPTLGGLSEYVDATRWAVDQQSPRPTDSQGPREEGEI